MQTQNDTRMQDQSYQCVLAVDNFEIRFYPEGARDAFISQAAPYKEWRRSGYLDIWDGSVSFANLVMAAAPYIEGDLPRSHDRNIKIKMPGDEYLAAVRFGGYASDRVIEFYIEKLDKLLKTNSIVRTGNFRFLSYNSPYRLFFRRNEIVASIVWD